MSIELDLMFAPGRTYARAVRAWPLPPVGGLVRPAGVAVILGGAMSISATGAADVRTILSTTMSWAFVPAIQTIIAVGLIASAPAPKVPRAAALDLFFAGYGPWSTWMLVYAAWAAAFPRPSIGDLAVLALAFAPLVWTIAIVYAFCREVLQLDSSAAVGRTALHQLVTWGLTLLLSGWAVQVWPRALGKLGW